MIHFIILFIRLIVKHFARFFAEIYKEFTLRTRLLRSSFRLNLQGNKTEKITSDQRKVDVHIPSRHRDIVLTVNVSEITAFNAVAVQLQYDLIADISLEIRRKMQKDEHFQFPAFFRKHLLTDGTSAVQ